LADEGQLDEDKNAGTETVPLDELGLGDAVRIFEVGLSANAPMLQLDYLPSPLPDRSKS
jgi:hypothetical protein